MSYQLNPLLEVNLFPIKPISKAARDAAKTAVNKAKNIKNVRNNVVDNFIKKHTPDSIKLNKLRQQNAIHPQDFSKNDQYYR